MLVKISCARCQGPLMLNEDHVGRLVRCPTCKSTFTAKAPELEVEEEPVQPALELIDPDPAPASAEEPVSIQLELEPPAPRPRPVEPPLHPEPIPAAESVPIELVAEPLPAPRPRPAEPLRPEPSPRRPVVRRRPGRRFHFPVRVLDDSNGELDGSIDAVANNDGLELRDGRRRLLFAPVGTPATYAGNNEVEVTIDQRRVRLAVTKRVGSQRLAQDLVDFLNEDRDPLNPDHYQVSRVLLVAGIGLPVAALLVVGVVLLVRFLTMVPRIDESAWKELKPAGARCRLLMPGTAITKQQHAPGLNQPLTMYVVELKRPNSAFLFYHFRLPDQEVGRLPLNQRFEAARQMGVANTPGAKFVSQREIKLDGHPGREYVVDLPKKKKLIARLYIVDGRELYMLLAGGDNFEPDTPDVVKFFDSFQILDDRPPGPAAGGPQPHAPGPGPDRPPPVRPDPAGPPPAEPPAGPWADPGPPPAPGGGSRLPVTFAPPAPVAIRPPDLGSDKAVVSLPGEVADVAVGGGGRYLVLHIPAQRQLAVFDVSAAKVVKTLPTSGEKPKLAAGMDKFVVVYPAPATVERWSFTTFKREATAELTMKVPPVAVALGSGSDGPLAISGVDYPRLGETVFFDIRTMRRLEMPFDPHGFFETSPSVFLRASADGRTFVCQAQAGAAIHSCVLSGGRLQSYRGMAGDSPVPGPDGIVYTSDGCYTPHWQRLSLSGSRRVPAHHGPYYLSVPGGAKGTVRLHLVGNNQPVLALDGVEGAEAPGSGLPLDKRFHLIPDAKVLVTIPASRDRLVVRRLDAERALERSGVEHLVVLSRPRGTVKPGADYAYRLAVKSSKAGVRYKLEAGPPGMTVSPEGVVSWKVPADFPAGETDIRVAVSNASERKIVHRFTITVAANGPPQDKGPQ